MQKFAQAAYKKSAIHQYWLLTERLLGVYEKTIRDKKKNH